jgi:hypothetical protein
MAIIQLSEIVSRGLAERGGIPGPRKEGCEFMERKVYYYLQSFIGEHCSYHKRTLFIYQKSNTSLQSSHPYYTILYLEIKTIIEEKILIIFKYQIKFLIMDFLCGD